MREVPSTPVLMLDGSPRKMTAEEFKNTAKAGQ